MKNLFKKSFVKVFLLLFILISFGTMLPTNVAKAEDFIVINCPNGWNLYGTVTLDKSVYAPNEPIIATGYIGVEPAYDGCISGFITAHNQNQTPNPPEESVVDAHYYLYDTATFYAPDFEGSDLKIIFTEHTGSGQSNITEIPYTVSVPPQNAVPHVINPTATNITTTSATLGATVADLGYPAVISARGTCWGTSALDPRLSVGAGTNCLPQGGTTLGVFTHSRTGLPPNTMIYYRGYATNATGTGYSLTSTFKTPIVLLAKNPANIKDIVKRESTDIPTTGIGTAYLRYKVKNIPNGQNCVLTNNNTIIGDSLSEFPNYQYLDVPNLPNSENDFQIHCTNPALDTPTVNVKGQSGTLAVSTGPASCIIPVGGNNCQIPFTWTTTSPRTDTTTWFVGGTPATPGNSDNYINTAVSGIGNISVGDTSGT